MFNDMVLNSYNLFNDNDIENFKLVGFIDNETYEKVKKLRQPSPANNGGENGNVN